MRKSLRIGFAAFASVAALVASAGTAAAGSAAPPKITGGVTMGMQYTSFNAFPGPPVKGTVSYTNFDVSDTSGVYRLASTVPIIFVFGGTFPHTLTISSEKPLAYNSLRFAGSGVFDADHSFTFDAIGTVTGDQVVMRVVYTGVGAGNTWDLVGTISATDGSISGTAHSPTGSSSDGTWTSPAGTAHSVFSYTANVTCAAIIGSNGTYGYTIPAGHLYALTPIVVAVHDGGLPSTNPDTWAFGTGTCGDPTPYAQTITDGNLVVH